MKLQMEISPFEAVYILAALTQIDQFQVRQDFAMRRDPLAVLHGLQQGTITYRLADPNEEWRTRRQILQTGWGDCEDLASAVAAELNETLYAGGATSVGAAMGGGLPLPRPPGPVNEPWPAFGACSPSFGSVPEQAVPVAYKARPSLFHVVVWAPGYGYLDPSVAGGMGSDYGASGKARERWLRSVGRDSPRSWRVSS